MNKLLLFVSICSAVVYASPVNKIEGLPPTFGTYSFSYTTDNSAKTEIRQADGSIHGAYTYTDKDGSIHDVKYLVSPDNGFKLLSHKLNGNDIKFDTDSGFTPEVQAIRDLHLSYQTALRTILPKLREKEIVQEIKPVKILHYVPEKVETEKILVKPTAVTPAKVTKIETPAILRQVPAESIKPEAHVKITRIETPVKLRFPLSEHGDDEEHLALPTIKEVRIEEFFPHYVRHVPSPVKRLPVVPAVDVLPPRRILNQNLLPPDVYQKVIVETYEEPPRVHQIVIPDVIRIEKINPKPKESQIVPQKVLQTIKEADKILLTSIPKLVIPKLVGKILDPVQIFESKKIIREEKLEEKKPNDDKVEIKPFKFANEIELIDGYTPEVAAARKQHLATYEAIKATLPELKEEKKEIKE